MGSRQNEDEMMAMFEAMDMDHDWTFRELAKGVGAPLSIEEEIEALEREATKAAALDRVG